MKPGSPQQVPGAAGASRRGAASARASTGTRRAQARLASGSARERGEGEAEAAEVDQRAGEHRPDDVGERRREPEPGEDPLQLGRRRCAMRPAERWIAIRPKFAPAPVSIAATQRPMNWPAGTKVRDHGADAAGDRQRDRDAGSAGDSRGGRRAGRRRARATIGAAANRPSRTPTAQAAWPSRSAASGAAMRTPAMHECSAIWPPISASSARVDSPAAAGAQSSASSVGVGVVEHVPAAAPGTRSSGSASTPCQAARHGAGAHLGLVDRVARLLQLLARVREGVRRTCRTRS